MGRSNLDVLVKLYGLILPALSEQLDIVRNAGGFLDLPPWVAVFLSQTHVYPWAQFYERKEKLMTLALYSLLGKELFIEVAEEMKPLSQEDRLRALLEVKKALVEQVENECVALSEEDSAFPSLEEIRLEVESLSPEERRASVDDAHIFHFMVITQLCSYFSLMSFGEPISNLIRKGKAGDDDALCKAVQVDKTLVYAVPEFRQRILKAQLGSEPGFLNSLANAIKGPCLTKKISYPNLMLFFYLLDDEGLLDAELNTLFDACQELGLYGPEYNVFDISSLGRMRSRYKKLAGRQIRF